MATKQISYIDNAATIILQIRLPANSLTALKPEYKFMLTFENPLSKFSLVERKNISCVIQKLIDTYNTSNNAYSITVNDIFNSISIEHNRFNKVIEISYFTIIILLNATNNLFEFLLELRDEIHEKTC